MIGVNGLLWATWALAHRQDSKGQTAYQQIRDHFKVYSCQTFIRAHDAARLMRAAHLEQHNFQMKRANDFVRHSVGSNGSD